MTPPNGDDLALMLERLSGAPVLVVGDVMLDRFLYGAVERISPEAPIPVLRVEREVAMLGGAGNVVRNLAALGAKPIFVAVVGDDPAGLEVQRLVAEVAGTGSHLLLDRNCASTIKERYIAAGQQLLRADREASQEMVPQLLAAILSAAEAVLPDVKALILSDYGKGVLAPEVLAPLIAAAKARGVPVVVDPKGRDYSRYRGASLVTPNRRELAEASGLATQTDGQVMAAAGNLLAGAGIERVLATLSERGMMLVEPGGAFHLPAEAREVFDVSGAGDTVVAAVGAGLAAGLPPLIAARIANIAAGIVVGKAGTAVATPAEILQTVNARVLLSAEAKVLPREALIEQAERWQRAGLKVGLTNGCFDLLHPGHISLVAQARAACDRLVVAINSDASVKRLKGSERPVQNESARALVLASLATVDAVTVFGEDTPMELIKALKPDLLVKGADYSRDQVVGGDEVESRGGKVLLVELLPGHSTSDTIRRLVG